MSDRLVFVSIKDGPKLPSGRPLRKAVVPLPEDTSWAEFLEKVRLKLKLPGVEKVYLAETLKEVSCMADLEDIDELLVAPTTAQTTGTNGGVVGFGAADNMQAAKVIATEGGTTVTPTKGISSGRTESVKRGVQRNSSGVDARDNDGYDVAGGLGAGGSGMRTDVDEHDLKYVRRVPAHTRMFQKIFGVAPTLPVTSADAENRSGGMGMQSARGSRGARGMARTQRGCFGITPFNAILLVALASCLATMMVLYAKLAAQDAPLNGN